jgi:hypothetical protein
MFFGKKQIHFKRTFENKVQFDLSKVHNYHLVKVLKKKISHFISLLKAYLVIITIWNKI